MVRKSTDHIFNRLKSSKNDRIQTDRQFQIIRRVCAEALATTVNPENRESVVPRLDQFLSPGFDLSLDSINLTFDQFPVDQIIFASQTFILFLISAGREETKVNFLVEFRKLKISVINLFVMLYFVTVYFLQTYYYLQTDTHTRARARVNYKNKAVCS